MSQSRAQQVSRHVLRLLIVPDSRRHTYVQDKQRWACKDIEWLKVVTSLWYLLHGVASTKPEIQVTYLHPRQGSWSLKFAFSVAAVQELEEMRSASSTRRPPRRSLPCWAVAARLLD